MSEYKIFFKKAAIRAIKTFFQCFASLLTVDSVTGMTEIDWIKIISVSCVSAIYSIVTSFAGLPEIDLENQLIKVLDKKTETENDFEF